MCATVETIWVNFLMFLTKGLSKVGNDFPDVYCNRNNHMDHSFSTYAKFYKKHFLPPDTPA